MIVDCVWVVGQWLATYQVDLRVDQDGSSTSSDGNGLQRAAAPCCHSHPQLLVSCHPVIRLASHLLLVFLSCVLSLFLIQPLQPTIINIPWLASACQLVNSPLLPHLNCETLRDDIPCLIFSFSARAACLFSSFCRCCSWCCQHGRCRRSARRKSSRRRRRSTSSARPPRLPASPRLLR